MRFIFWPQPFQNLDCFIDSGRIDLNCLETTLERGILLDVLAIFVHRRRANTLQFAAAQSRLDNVGSVHGAFGRARTDDGVQLVDKENHVLGATDFVHHRFDALFELAAILGSGDHQCEIERDHSFVAQ